MHLVATSIASLTGATGGGYLARRQQNNLPLRLRRDALPIGLGAGLTFAGSSLFVTAINPVAIIVPTIIAGGVTYLMTPRNRQESTASTSGNNTSSSNDEANINDASSQGSINSQETMSEARSVEAHIALWPRLQAGLQYMFCKKDTSEPREVQETLTDEEKEYLREDKEAEEYQKQQAEARARRRAYEQTPEYKEDGPVLK